MHAILLAVTLGTRWAAWQYTASIANNAAPMQTFVVPPAVLDRSQADLSDLRIVDANHDELPYTISIRSGGQSVEWIDARLSDYGFFPGLRSQVVARVERPRDEYREVQISTSRTNFATTADVYASDDGTQWRLIKSGAPLFDYQSEGLGSNSRIRVPLSRSPWYRVVVHDSRAAFPLDGVRLAQGNETRAELSRFDAGTTISRDGSQTLLTLDTHTRNAPISLMRFSTITPRFAREVEVETSNDGKNWQTAGDGHIERDAIRQQLAVSFDEVQGRFVRARVINGNDVPLAALKGEAWGTPRHVIFARAKPPVVLVFGNGAAAAPSYDFAQTHTNVSLASAVPVAVQHPVANDDYRPPQAPWTERNGWVLWAGLAAAVAVVGFLAFRVLTSSAESA